MIIALSVLGILFFVAGMSIVLSWYAAAPAPETVVSREEADKMEQELTQAREAEAVLKQQLDTLTVELESSRSSVDQMKELEKYVDNLRGRDQENQETIQNMRQNLEFLQKRADEQAQKALESIERLREQERELESQTESPDPELLAKLEQEKQVLDNQLSQNNSRIQTLEQELHSVQVESQGKLSAADEMCHRLQAQNEMFQQGIARITGKISEVEGRVARAQHEKDQQLAEARRVIEELREERARISEERGGDPRQVAALEEEVKRIQSESAGRLQEAHEHMTHLQQEMLQMKEEIDINRQKRLGLETELEEARQRSYAAATAGEQEGLSEEWESQRIELEHEIAELRETNHFLRDKEDLLREELHKSQAQALGLEKICEEFDDELEG
ncbi:MAG: hypothetical protein ACLFPX_04700 [Candidatus Omnitrophota bacterium]